MLKDVLERILEHYLDESQSDFKNNDLASYIRHEGAYSLEQALGKRGIGLAFEGSPGRGQWATVPWLAVFNPNITTSAQSEYYIVYLFSADFQQVHLSMNQGTTAVEKEFKARANGILAHRADLIRRRVPEYSDEFSGEPIHLASSRELPAGYEAGHAFGKTYNRLSIPDIDELAADLGKMVGLYLTL